MILNKFTKWKTWPDLESIEKKDQTINASRTKPVNEIYSYNANADRTEILWKCLVCGELKPRNQWILGNCPACGAEKSQFVLVDED
jgi:rubrerythrin